MKSVMLGHDQTLHGAVPIAVGFVSVLASQIPNERFDLFTSARDLHNSPSAVGVLEEMSANHFRHCA